ncbi:MAG: hypothetical protein ABI893_00600 [Polaromonas sp.]
MNATPAHAPHLPPIGAYLKPIGQSRYRYCCKVLNVAPADDGWNCDRVYYERWGQNDDGLAFNDGHLSKDNGMTGIIYPVGKEAWRVISGCDWFGIPLYYRLTQSLASASAPQMALFA